MKEEMTRETAKRKVEMLDSYLSHTCQDYGERDHEAMMMAIKALEKEPCEDVISRQAVLDIVKFEENWLLDAKGNNADTDIAFSGIRTQVAKLSPVIKALEPCEDAISRKAVLDMATTIQTDDFSGNEVMEVVDVDDIKTLPPVTPTRKKGKWIVLKDEYGDICEAICSCCEDNGNHKWKYCPNCGAEMEE